MADAIAYDKSDLRRIKGAFKAMDETALNAAKIQSNALAEYLRKKIQEAGMEVQGGFIVGFILSLLNTFLGNARVYAYSYLFLAVVVILLVRPGGILSKRNEMERV